MRYQSDSNKAIDVSVHNGHIYWPTVAAHGYKAIVRCGYGDDFAYQDDKRWQENAQGAASVGALIGVYIYSYAQSMVQVRSEAAHALRCLRSLPFECKVPVFLDLEEWWQDEKKTKPTWQRQNALAAAVEFTRIMNDAGYCAGVYASLEAWQNTDLADYAVGLKWVAAWRESLDCYCDVWQYTSDGSVPGVPSRCDVNNVYFVNPVPPGSIDSLDDLVRRVYADDFGRGQARKDALGPDYQRVQERVNEYYQMARRVRRGEFGDQPHRQPVVEAAGFNYGLVQRIVNDMIARGE